MVMAILCIIEFILDLNGFSNSSATKTKCKPHSFLVMNSFTIFQYQGLGLAQEFFWTGASYKHR